MSVVTVHMVYFCAFARSEIFPKIVWKSGVGRGQFDAGVNGLTIKSKLSNTIIVLYLNLVQHDLFSCDNSFFVISQSFQHYLWHYIIYIAYKYQTNTVPSKIILFTKNLLITFVQGLFISCCAHHNSK